MDSVMTDNLPKVDVVIPVYNAPEETKRCIDLLYHHVAHRMNGLYIHDDCSRAETATMLDSLDYPNYHVVHAEENGGFASSVNHGVSRTSTNYILVLNSDVIPRDDFIGPLLEVMEANKMLGALNVGGEPYYRKEFAHYDQSNGYVVSYDLSGYAFIVRRDAWEQVEGLDTVFGRGYYEDNDISRRLIQSGWQLGIHAGTYLGHKNHASFDGVEGIPEVYKQNRKRYFERYPGAYKRILIMGHERTWSDLPESLVEDLGKVLQNGGSAYWFNRRATHPLPCPEVKLYRFNLPRLLKLIKRRSKAPVDKPVEIWSTDTLSPIQKLIAKRIVKSYNVPWKTFQQTKQPS